MDSRHEKIAHERKRPHECKVYVRMQSVCENAKRVQECKNARPWWSHVQGGETKACVQ
jgi:hypothetical protein